MQSKYLYQTIQVLLVFILTNIGFYATKTFASTFSIHSSADNPEKVTPDSALKWTSIERVILQSINLTHLPKADINPSNPYVSNSKAKVLGAYLFGGITIFQLHAQALGIGIPSQVMSMLPYLATILVLVLISQDKTKIKLNAPASLGKPFHESR